MIDDTGIYYIYSYTDPRDRIPRYIGRGKNNRSAWWRHVTKNDKKRGVRSWLWELKSQHLEPIVTVVLSRLTKPQVFRWEKDLVDFIGRVSEGDGPLLNISPGGDSGGHKHTDKELEKMSASIRAAWAACTPAERQEWVDATVRGRMAMTPEEKQQESAAVSAAQTARWAAMTPEERECHNKSVAAGRVAWWSAMTQEEQQRQMEAPVAGKAAWLAGLTQVERERYHKALSEGVKAGRTARPPEVKQRHAKNNSVAKTAMWAAMTQEERERLGESMSASHLARWASKTPEERRQHGEAVSAGSASRALGFKATYYQIRLGYQSLTGQELIVTPLNTCRKAALELLDIYGREHVEVVLTGIPVL